MHLLLTDVAVCPRCGPEFGLILLADRVDDRRVIEGRLGCANCREEYPVREGVLDLRYPPGEAVNGGAGGAAPDPERALRFAALLGVTGGGEWVLIFGGGVGLASEVAALVPDVRVISMGGPESGGAGTSSISRVVADAAVPLRPRSLSGVALAGRQDASAVAEVARLLRPGGRLVVEPAPPEAAAEARSAGLEILLEDGGTLVAGAGVARPQTRS